MERKEVCLLVVKGRKKEYKRVIFFLVAEKRKRVARRLKANLSLFWHAGHKAK